MRCQSNHVLLVLLLIVGCDLLSEANLCGQAPSDSVVVQVVNSFSMAGRSGYTRITIRSTDNLVGISIPLRIEEPRLIIDSVSTASSIAGAYVNWMILFSETERCGPIRAVPQFSLHEFLSRTGELFRVHWHIRPEAIGGIAEVDTCHYPAYVGSNDTIYETINAAGLEGFSFHCSFIPGTIQFSRYACGEVGGLNIQSLGNAVYFLDFIFGGGPSPLDESYGDLNCDQAVTISDVVYLIEFLFNDGPGPCAECPPH